MQRHGHSLYLHVGRLTKGFKIQFRYDGCGIRRVNVLDFLAGTQPTRVEQAQDSASAPNANVACDGWVMPRSGTTFVWVLEEETKAFGTARVVSPGGSQRIFRQHDQAQGDEKISG